MSTSLNSSPNDGQFGDVNRHYAEAAETAPARSVGLERTFDSSSERDWCYLIRDILAKANTGGGEINLRSAPDSAAITRNDVLRRIAEYSDTTFDDIELRPADSPGVAATVISIGRTLFPIVMTKAGRYADSDDPAKVVEAFPPGGIYFWHGDRSEPGGTEELREFVERLLRRVRRRWLAGIRRVVKTPIDSAVRSTATRKGHRSRKTHSANLQPVRITTDPQAPAMQPQDVDRLYPWRQKDLLHELSSRLGRRALTTYDIQAVRRHHRLDERPEFVFHLPGAGRRYSPAVAQWMIEQHERDAEFFKKARRADQEMLKLRRKKPK
jgi:hypothetical protein